MTSHANPSATAQLHVTFVCTGNICRSPMGDVILNSIIQAKGLADRVIVDSCGIGGWHVGQKADKRALAELARAGFDGSRHRASQIDERKEEADLLIAMDEGHVRDLARLGVPSSRIRLLRSFDPTATDSNVEDPYYGSERDFTTARRQIEQAMPGILEWIYSQLD